MFSLEIKGKTAHLNFNKDYTNIIKDCQRLCKITQKNEHFFRNLLEHPVSFKTTNVLIILDYKTNEKTLVRVLYNYLHKVSSSSSLTFIKSLNCKL